MNIRRDIWCQKWSSSTEEVTSYFLHWNILIFLKRRIPVGSHLHQSTERIMKDSGKTVSAVSSKSFYCQVYEYSSSLIVVIETSPSDNLLLSNLGAQY